MTSTSPDDLPRTSFRPAKVRPVVRGVVYFMLVFAVGFALGILRVSWLVPLAGERVAELVEMPLMLIAIYLAARFVIRRFPARRPSSHLASGALALLLLVSVEFSVVLWLRGLSVGQYLTERDPIAGGVYVVMLGVFALAPWLLRRSRHAARAGQHP
ncbi:MAG: hypothetical protein RIC56_23825 [Pseudomonadales bacterium]